MRNWRKTMTAKTYANLTIWLTFVGMGSGLGAEYFFGFGLRSGRVELFWLVWGIITWMVSFNFFMDWWPEYKRDFNDDHG
jgi:hypothetical protein